ncbi:CRISPR-associated RAMP protein Csx7 [Alkalinema pantanalense CENA528]|uniref:type III CRISPR-associated RAMP protein Csx7 n=1 Tax=Alkalinema pantanalense TaxID=1620705 RepID=UPI003D6F5085
MFDKFQNRLEIIGTLNTVTAIRVGAGRSIDPIGTDLPVMKDVLGQPIIPGSSFKGALRSRVEAFLRAVNSDFASAPSDLIDKPQDDIKKLKEAYRADPDRNDEALTKAILAKTDQVSQIFGAPWLAGKLQIRDLTVMPGTWFGQYQERDGVGIDRDTETAVGGAKYDFQVVPAGTVFQFQAVIENAEDWQLGLLMLGLNQFEREQVPLGGARSRGLGVVKLEIEAMNWVDVCRDGSTEPDPEKVLTYIQCLVEADGIPFEDGLLQRSRWVASLITYLRNTPTEMAGASSVE